MVFSRTHAAHLIKRLDIPGLHEEQYSLHFGKDEDFLFCGTINKKSLKVVSMAITLSGLRILENKRNMRQINKNLEARTASV